MCMHLKCSNIALTNAYFTKLLQVHVYLSTANWLQQALCYQGDARSTCLHVQPVQHYLNYRKRYSQITCICTHILQCYLLPSRSCTVPPSNRFFSCLLPPSSSPSFSCTASVDVYTAQLLYSDQRFCSSSP